MFFTFTPDIIYAMLDADIAYDVYFDFLHDAAIRLRAS